MLDKNPQSAAATVATPEWSIIYRPRREAAWERIGAADERGYDEPGFKLSITVPEELETLDCVMLGAAAPLPDELRPLTHHGWHFRGRAARTGGRPFVGVAQWFGAEYYFRISIYRPPRAQTILRGLLLQKRRPKFQ